jgi:hypothetical protein
MSGDSRDKKQKKKQKQNQSLPLHCMYISCSCLFCPLAFSLSKIIIIIILEINKFIKIESRFYPSKSQVKNPKIQNPNQRLGFFFSNGRNENGGHAPSFPLRSSFKNPCKSNRIWFQ